MPLIDLRSTPRANALALTECDVCIVGTGPAGSTIASELAGGRLRVTVLESGGFERLPEADALNEVESVGKRRVADQWKVRNRIVGGSSHTWGGRGAPFDKIDFEERPWVPGSGWPVTREELAPYFERAAAHLGLAMGDGFIDERFWELAPGARYPIPPNPALIQPFYWQFSRDPEESYPYEYMRFGRRFVDRLGPSQTLVTGATVLRVDPASTGNAGKSVVFAGPDGVRHELRAAAIVLCAGGIENARILLASDTVTPAGLGNDHDLVGRYLMDHPRGSAATFPPDAARELQRSFSRFNVRSRLFRAGFRLSPEVQQAEGLLNAAAWLGEAVAPDDPWDGMRRLVRGGSSRRDAAKHVVGNLGYVARGVPDYFIHHTGIPRKLSELRLDIMCEQRPDPESRIVLTERTDPLGARIPRIDWRSHPDEGRSVRRLAQLVQLELGRMGLPTPTLDAWVRAGEDLPDSWVDVAHPTGTTRMADDPHHGVVDSRGQVHGVPGLYVAGSSVFPTAGHVNPTEMVVALAIRTADAIRANAQRPQLVEAAAAPAPAPTPAPTPAKVLVTGGTGRIGRVLVRELVERGYLVRATTSRALPEPLRGVEWVPFDLETAAAADFDGLLEGCVGVLHLAALLGSKERMPRVNTEATRLLAEATERAGITVMCYTSTISVYGSGRRRVADENATVLTIERDIASEYLALDYVRAYGRTKLAGEQAIRSTARNTHYVILRPTVVVDVEQLLEVREWSTSKRFLAAHRHAHHVYALDVADALIWAMERSLAGASDDASGAAAPGGVEVFNLGEDELPRPTHADFMRDAYAASGDPRFRVVPVPGVVDWAQDLGRLRTVSTRNPLWRMRFPSDSIREAGYRPRYGVAYARALALERLRSERRDQGAEGTAFGQGASTEPPVFDRAPVGNLAGPELGHFDAIVLGAGMSGLVSASVLVEQQAGRVLVLDEYEKVGGNHIDREVGGYTFDVGSLIFQDDSPLVHRFPELLPHYVPIDPKWSRLNPQGLVTEYPFSIHDDIVSAGPIEWLRIAFSLGFSRLRYRRQHNARDFARYWVGRRLAQRAGLEHYMERFCGLPGEQIDLEFARSRMMWIAERAHLRVQVAGMLRARRGGSAEPARKNQQLVRPREGFAALYQPVVDTLESSGVEFRLGTQLVRIDRLDPGFRIQTADGAYTTDRIISTVPIEVAQRLIGLQRASLPTVTLVTLFYSFEGDRGFRDPILYNFSHDGTWKRLTMHSDFYGLHDGREFFAVEVVKGPHSQTVEEADRRFREHIAQNGLFTGDLVLEGGNVLDHAYPVFTGGSGARAAEAVTEFRGFGLESFGKQGGFDYQPTARVSTQRAERALRNADSAVRT